MDGEITTADVQPREALSASIVPGRQVVVSRVGDGLCVWSLDTPGRACARPHKGKITNGP